jgi:hypothetical protein
MFCTKCGKQVRDGLKYCTNCGAPIKQHESGGTGGQNRIVAGGKVNLKKDDDTAKPVAVSQPSNSISFNTGNTGGNAPVKKPKKNKGIKIAIITILGIIAALLLIIFALAQTGVISISVSDNENQESTLDKSKSSKREKEKERRAKEKESESKSEASTAPTAEQTEPNTMPTVAQTESVTVPSTVAMNSEFILPDSSTRVLDKSELAGFSAEQCRLARNEIYAKHGRIFDDAGLQNYFNSRSWYHGTIPADKFSETMLSDIEIQNRNLIIAYEKEMGYTK